MKVKLIDFHGYEEEVTTGTCDMCMSTTYAEFRTFVFRNEETKEVFSVEGQFWSWGDLFQVDDIENIPHFAAYLIDREVVDLEDCASDFDWLDRLIDAYDDYLR